MGLLDFTKSIGRKLFGSEDEAPQKIKEMINTNNPGIEDFDVSVANGIATVSGHTNTPEAREKAILMVGNTQGIERVEDRIDAPNKDVASSFYIVEPGDSLWKIAEKTLGDGSKNNLIYAANREVIIDADKIYPGQKLRIPSDG